MGTDGIDRLFAHDIVAVNPDTSTITASFGVALFPAHASDPDALIRAADEALYGAKRYGRDR